MNILIFLLFLISPIKENRSQYVFLSCYDNSQLRNEKLLEAVLIMTVGGYSIDGYAVYDTPGTYCFKVGLIN